MAKVKDILSTVVVVVVIVVVPAFYSKFCNISS